MASPLLILLGPPAAGKGTLAQFLTDRFGWQSFSTGAVLRRHIREGTPIGRRIAPILTSGYLLPDNIVLEVVGSELAGTAGGLVLDGFPRTIGQARQFDVLCRGKGWSLDAVVSLEGRADDLVGRVGNRLTCPECAAIFRRGDGSGLDIGSPCPECGAALGRRRDDDPDVFRERFAEYEKATRPLVGFYQSRGLLVPLAATSPLEEKKAALEALARRIAPAAP